MIDVRRADGRRDPEQVEGLLVARIVDARDRLLDAVAVARDLADDDVVLVVARDGDDEAGAARCRSARARTARWRRRAGRRARTPPRASGSGRRSLDHGHLVAHLEQVLGEVAADLAAAGDQDVHLDPRPRRSGRRSSACRSPPSSGRRCAGPSRGTARRAPGRACARPCSRDAELALHDLGRRRGSCCRRRCATTQASARSIPAARSTSSSSACPSKRSPVNAGSSRLNDSPASSITATDQPSSARSRGHRRANATAADHHGVHERLPLSGERASGA